MFGKLTATLALLAPVNAMWILSSHVLNYQRLDPLVNPGVVSPHTHSVVGSNAFAPVMNYETTQTATCTTAPVQADKSSYWAQTLFHKAANGTFQLIPISFVQLYYLNRPEDGKTSVESLPKGLRMVAGNPYRSTYNASNMEDRAITFVCLNYNDKSNDSGDKTTFPTRQCPDGMRMQVNFPSCWDGKNLDSADHKSHMSYPVNVPDAGNCPASHPVKIIEVFNEYVYDVGKFDYIPGQDNWVTSTGDPTGLSFHADFIDGWDHSVLDPAVAQCTGLLFGDLESCPPFRDHIDKAKAAACTLPAAVQEDVISPRPNLPGCNHYTGKTPTGPSVCPGLVVPAIKGGAAASTVAGTPASSTSASSAAASTSAAHTASSSSAAASSIPATVHSSSSSVAATGSPASSSAVGATSVATSIAGTATATPVAGTATATSSKHHGHKGHHAKPTTSHISVNPIRTVSTAHATATAIKGGKQCKREIARDALKAAAEAKYKRAVHAHHAGIKNRLAASH